MVTVHSSIIALLVILVAALALAILDVNWDRKWYKRESEVNGKALDNALNQVKDLRHKLALVQSALDDED